MKNVVSFIFLLALLVSGCTQDEMLRNGTSASGGRIFTTSFENDESRTYVEDGHLLRWTAGDQISLFDGNTLPLQYQFKGWTGDNAGTFYMVSKPEGNGSPLNHNYAVYPYSQDVKISKEGVLIATLPSKQHYAMNSFGLGDNTMVAVTRNVDDLFLNFKNVGGFLKLQLYGDDITVKSITLTGNNGEKIAGEAMLAVGYDEVPMVSMADSAATSITLDCGENGVKIGTTAEEATEFWMVIPPVVFEKGITIKVRDFTNGVFTKTTDKKLVIERNVVKPMAVVKAVMEQERTSLAFSTDGEELEGWSAGIFGGEGTYVMGKPYGENGYLMTIGNVLEDRIAIVYMDESRQIRELFVDNTIITFGENTNGSVSVSIIDKDGNETIEQIALSSINLQSRASDDHGQQVGAINFVLNVQDMCEGLNDVLKSDVFKGKEIFGGIKAIVNAPTVISNLVKALGGPDIYSAAETVANWLDWSQNTVDLAELFSMFKNPAGIGGPAGACIAAWAGCYAKYLELYDEHIKAYFGNNQVFIKDITYKGNGLNIELAISGCEPWYDVECGVIVKTESFPAPRYSDGLATKTVVRNGEYIFVEGNVQTDKTYYCRPFLITKDRATLWVGYIGEKIGPLVRYGETEEYKPEDELREALIKLYESTNGDNWIDKGNWCSDKPVEEWLGIAKDANGKYGIALYNNNLTGKIDQEFPECVIALNCNDNQLTSINVSGSAALERILCDSNQLVTLDVSNCSALKTISFDYNQLFSLDVSGCLALQTFEFYENQLVSLDVSGCLALQELSFSANQLTSLKASECTSLKTIDCKNCQLTSLNISGCTSLKTIKFTKNNSASLEISNSATLENLRFFDSSGSAVVSDCASLKNVSCRGLTSFTVLNCAALEELNLINGDGYLLTSLKVSGCPALQSLACTSNQLTSLDVTDCSALQSLSCSDNQLTSFDVTGCPALQSLDCYNTQLTSLDVTRYPALQSLDCHNNSKLTSLNVIGCSALQSLNCRNTQLTSLDVSNLKKLTSLDYESETLTSINAGGCVSLKGLIISEYVNSVNLLGCTSLERLYKYDRRYLTPLSLNVSGCISLAGLNLFRVNLTSLNVSGCVSLENIDCTGGSLTSLDVSNLKALKVLTCTENQLNSLNVSGCSSLESLWCADNQLTSLDVTGCPALQYLYCSNNQLTSLSVSNPNKLVRFDCTDNKLFGIVPDWVKPISDFLFDKRYSYYYEKVNAWESVEYYIDYGIGWWYEGEPHAGSKPDPDWKM